VVVSPDGKPQARGGATNSSGSKAVTNGTGRTEAGITSRSNGRSGLPTGPLMQPTSRAAFRFRTWGRYRLEVSAADASTPTTAVGFDSGFYAEAGADTPTSWRPPLTSRNIAPAIL